jgi:hypothetical protein
MIAIVNFWGYTAPDPLDRASTPQRIVLTMAVSGAVALLFLFAQSAVLHVVMYQSAWVFWLGCVGYTFVMGALLALLYKSSSLLFYLMIVAVCVPTDLWLQAQYRDQGLTAWWTYESGTFISAIPVPLRFLVAWSFNGLIQGPLVLWFTRLLAHAIYPATAARPAPTRAQQAALFPPEWSSEAVARPRRDVGYWILRLLGLGYLVYLLFSLMGVLGASPWPAQAQQLLVMTYQNPALGINTFSKISLMVLLAFIGAYHRNVRWYATLGLLVGHLVSTLVSLGFYAYDPPGTYPNSPMPTYRDFLLTSALVDGAMVLLFVWILIRSHADSRVLAPEPEFPDFISLPDQLSRWFFYALGTALAVMIPVVLLIRLLADGAHGLGAVYGYPDPQLGNSITRFSTMSLVAFLLARREKLRDYLTGVLIFGFGITLVGSSLFAIFADMLGKEHIVTRGGALTTVDWYFVLQVAIDTLVVVLLIGLRKMVYNIDYVINALNPTSAQNVVALHAALHAGSPVDNATVLQAIDRHVAGVHGRKRGLLNFPFWMLEHLFSPMYGLHPTFSNLSPDEGRAFLRKYVLRPPGERQRAFVPVLAEFTYKIGTAVHAFITFAHYSSGKGWEEVGYVPPDARDRLQGDYPAVAPPFAKAAPLPDSPTSPDNDQPADPPPPCPLVAPRVTTPVATASLPDAVDYLIVGSGAGGACMAYRLACAVADPAQLLVVERGPRFAPRQDFNDNEMEMIRKLYKEGSLQQSKRFDLMVLQGECVGGTTVINNAICLPMPPHIRQLWENAYGLELADLFDADGAAPAGHTGEYTRVGQELEISAIPEVAINGRVKETFFRGVDAYNARGNAALRKEHLRANQRNMLGDGLCNLGNKRLRKRSMLETYIPWAEARGVKVLSDTSAVRFLTDRRGTRAEAVLLRTTQGNVKRVQVRKAVIVAAGMIASSHLLMRSGVTRNVGQGMSCNFAFPVAFEFPQALDAFDGT